MQRQNVRGLAAACLALTLSACAPQPTCLELIPVRGTAVDDLGVAGPACLQHDEVTAQFETATWADLQAQAREVTGDPALTLSIGALDVEPNHPTLDERLVFLADDLGRMYGFEPSTQILRVIQPSTLVWAEPGQAVSHDRLRTRAQDYAALYAPDVLADNGAWVYSEGVKDPIYFFDWRSNGAAPAGQNPHRFLVALLSDGQLFSYMNYAPSGD